jgi:hypothetical protein
MLVKGIHLCLNGRYLRNDIDMFLKESHML